MIPAADAYDSTETDRELTPEPWVEYAACAGMDVNLFFPTPGNNTRQAVAVCNACPVRAECLEHALRVPERFGVFGGKSEKDRRRMRSERNRARPNPFGRALRSVQ